VYLNNDDGIGDIFRNNDLALRHTDSTEGVDDDDDPWVLTDGTRLVNKRKGGGINLILHMHTHIHIHTHIHTHTRETTRYCTNST